MLYISLMKRSYDAKITSNGRVTIPVELRRELKVSAGDVIEFTIEAGKIRLAPVVREPQQR